jgi:hypothetical protein
VFTALASLESHILGEFPMAVLRRDGSLSRIAEGTSIRLARNEIAEAEGISRTLASRHAK